ncbi:MAG: FadR/GntR family transcriptional regulator [Alkalilacustris sp.]
MQIETPVLPPAQPMAAENSHLALEALRRMLAGLPEGMAHRLPTERALAEELGISRRSVRRALEVLVSEGLVWRRQGAGTFAGPRLGTEGRAEGGLAVPVDPLEVMEVRLRMEPQIAQLAALRAGPEAVARVAALVARLDTTEDADERELWDSALHREIARATGNRMFLAIFDALDGARRDPRWRALRERARGGVPFALYQDQHRAIRDAIAAHDPVAAGDAMRAHLLSLNEALLRQTSLEGLPDG